MSACKRSPTETAHMTTRVRVLVGPATAAAVLLGITGCSAGSSSGAGATTSPASSKSVAQSQWSQSSSSASHSASPASTKPQSTSPAHSATTSPAALKVVSAKHYTYVALPSQLEPIVSGLKDSGLVT